MSKNLIPSEALDKHIALLGGTGSGKTSTAKTAIVEPALTAGERVLVIDPTSAWWGLRLGKDGKAKGFPIYIFGGDHGDYPLRARDAEILADAFGTSSDSAVFDTSLMTVAERTQFFTDFAEAIRRKNRGPLKIVIDESHLFMPQSGAKSGGAVPAMLHAGNNLVSLGRSRGLRITLISQRPAKLHKDSLTQVQSLVAMRLLAPQDRNAISDWIADQADPKALTAARAEGYAAGWLEGDRDGFARGAATALSQGFQAIRGAMKAFVGVEFVPSKRAPKVPAGAQAAPVRSQPAPVPRPAARNSAAPPRQSAGTVSLPPGERAVLIAAAQFEGVEREQLTVLTGYKRSSRDAYIQRLREKGFVEVSGSTVVITADGEAALPGDYEPLPTGSALREYWLARLPEGERRVLEVLIAAYPDAVDRTVIDEKTGYKRSSRDAYLQRMKAKRLWDAVGGEVRAAEMLFE